MRIHVESEVGRLRRVLMHEPGLEVDRMVPSMMEELLFDDILYGDAGRAEHARFRALMTHLGVEVVEFQDLLVQAMAEEEARTWLLQAMADDLPRSARDLLEGSTPEEFASRVIRGIRHPEDRVGLGAGDLFDLPPLPNLCFQRDPQVVLGDGVVFSAMATPTRWREALLSRAIFRFHPELREVPVIMDPLKLEADRPLYLGLNHPSFEGGDVLVLSKDVVAVGASERTNRSGVRKLARGLARLEGGPRWMVAVVLPNVRAYMHLDTVMTPIDRDQCLAFPPVILPGGAQAASTYVVDLHADELQFREAEDVLPTLAKLGVGLEAIPCGGEDPLDQEREQWTDGANAIAIAPGILVLFDRNVKTADALAQRGYDVVAADDILLGKVKVDPDQPKRTCILIPSNEISRARGGPHCLTHPLTRDA